MLALLQDEQHPTINPLQSIPTPPPQTPITNSLRANNILLKSKVTQTLRKQN